MKPFEVIDEVRRLGGEVLLDGERLMVRAPAPLPAELMVALSDQKVAIMVALGSPQDAVVSSILEDIRPYLPPSLRRQPDGRLLALVNWTIIAAWQQCLRDTQVR